MALDGNYPLYGYKSHVGLAGYLSANATMEATPSLCAGNSLMPCIDVGLSRATCVKQVTNSLGRRGQKLAASNSALNSFTTSMQIAAMVPNHTLPTSLAHTFVLFEGDNPPQCVTCAAFNN
jgi:hypothetical protein